MRSRSWIALMVVLVVAAASCAKATAPGESPLPIQGLSAEGLSPSRVRLEWPILDGAESYLLEGRYGDGEYSAITELPADRSSFTHSIVPGSTGIDYRLSAQTGAGLSELDNLSLSLPEYSPNSLVVESQAYAPAIGGLPEFPILPTIAPANPDLNALATAIAAVAGSAATDSSPQVIPVSAEQEVGPEGGTATVTDPNGVVYTLELLPGAVAGTTTITLTPIEAFSEFPFAGGLLGAVQIHPPIPFAGPATLTIALPPDSAAPNSPVITGFSVSSSSSELSLAPIFDDGQNAYSMDVYWGDTLGLAPATLGEIGAQAARIPSDWRAQMTQQLAAMVAANSDRSLDGELLIAAQVLQGLLQQTQDLTARTMPNGGAGLAAPVPAASIRPMFQGQSAARLLVTVIWSEPIWDFLNQMLPTYGFESIPLENETANAMATWRERIVSDLTQAIKAYMDEHDGCRTGLALYAEAPPIRTAHHLRQRPWCDAGSALIGQCVSGICLIQRGRLEPLRPSPNAWRGPSRTSKWSPGLLAIRVGG